MLKIPKAPLLYALGGHHGRHCRKSHANAFVYFFWTPHPSRPGTPRNREIGGAEIQCDHGAYFRGPLLSLPLDGWRW